MNRRPARAALVSMLPLGVALTALVLRQSTYEPHRPEVSACRATEFVPPPSLVLASNAPQGEQELRVDARHCSARLMSARRDGARAEQLLRAAGTMRILADESLADLELDLVPRTSDRGFGWEKDLVLHLRGVTARSHATAVPGVRACSLRCFAILAGSSQDSSVEVSWIRLPGGEVRLHAVAPIDGAPFDPPVPWLGRVLPADENSLLGLDLVLRAER